MPIVIEAASRLCRPGNPTIPRPFYAYTYSTSHSASPVATAAIALALGANAGVDLSGIPVLSLMLALVTALEMAGALEVTLLLLLFEA